MHGGHVIMIMCVLTQQTTQMCLICGVLRSKVSTNSKPVYSARSVDNVCGPQNDSLKQIMCFIRKQIRDTGNYDWKVFSTSFQVQTFA